MREELGERLCQRVGKKDKEGKKAVGSVLDYKRPCRFLD